MQKFVKRNEEIAVRAVMRQRSTYNAQYARGVINTLFNLNMIIFMHEVSFRECLHDTFTS